MTSDNTPGVTDALLVQLTCQPFDDEAIRKVIALLRESSMASDSVARIARTGARDWKFFHAVYDNLVALERILDKYLAPEEAQRVWQRIELIQAEMDRAPKSFGWMVNQVLRKPAQVPQ